jgi:hypothetical protein
METAVVGFFVTRQVEDLVKDFVETEKIVWLGKM